jgi:hypothetical protein
MTSLERRIIALERTYDRLLFDERGSDKLTVIKVRGGLADCMSCAASVGGLTLGREPGETEADFTERVIELAHETGARFVVIGGLPTDGMGRDDK